MNFIKQNFSALLLLFSVQKSVIVQCMQGPAGLLDNKEAIEEKFSTLDLTLSRANINATDEYGRTQLHCAAELGQIEIIDLLITKGADIYKTRLLQDKTAFEIAIINGQSAAAAFLLSKGARVNHTDKVTQETPLHYAACFQYHENLKRTALRDFLLSRGHEIDVARFESRSVFALVRHLQNPEATQFLLSLQQIEELKRRELVTFLLRNGANINAQDIEGQTVLHHAAKMEDKELVALLLSKGADIMIKDVNGKTPLDLAEDKAISALLKQRADSLENLNQVVDTLHQIEKTADRLFVAAKQYRARKDAEIFLQRAVQRPPVYSPFFSSGNPSAPALESLPPQPSAPPHEENE